MRMWQPSEILARRVFSEKEVALKRDCCLGHAEKSAEQVVPLQRCKHISPRGMLNTRGLTERGLTEIVSAVWVDDIVLQ